MQNVLALNPSFLYRNNFSRGWRIILRMVWILGIFSVVSLLTLLIVQINSEAAERYSASTYEKKLGEISRENNNLEISSLQSNSLDGILTQIQDLNFEKTERVTYIKVLGGQVVSKKIEVDKK